MDDYILKEKEKLDNLKEVGDFRSILKEYFLSSEIYDDDIKTEEDRVNLFIKTEVQEYCFGILKDNLDSIEPILYDKDPSSTKHAIYFLENFNDPKGLIFLTKCLLSKKKNEFQSQIKDILCKSENLSEIEEFLISSADSVYGRRLALLVEIISNLQASKSLERAIFKIHRYRCPRTFEMCSKDIVPINAVFVGHIFSKEIKTHLRPNIDAAIKAIDKDCLPYYADEELQSDLFCKICEKIQTTRLGIYDVSSDCDECGKANPNVALELGMSMAFGKKTIVVLKKNIRALEKITWLEKIGFLFSVFFGSDLPGPKRSSLLADLAWSDRIEYKSYEDLKLSLLERLPGILSDASNNFKWN